MAIFLQQRYDISLAIRLFFTGYFIFDIPLIYAFEFNFFCLLLTGFDKLARLPANLQLDQIKNNPTTKRLRLETNAAFLLLVPGPKMVWQFGEIGYDISIEQNGRTGRKPLIQETAERTKLRQTYTKLLHLRATHPELWEASASFDWKIAGHWTNGRRMTLSKDGKELRVIGNFYALAPLRYQAPAGAAWHDMMDQKSRIVSDTLIAPGGFVVLGNFQ